MNIELINPYDKIVKHNIIKNTKHVFRHINTIVDYVYISFNDNASTVQLSLYTSVYLFKNKCNVELSLNDIYDMIYEIFEIQVLACVYESYMNLSLLLKQFPKCNVDDGIIDILKKFIEPVNYDYKLYAPTNYPNAPKHEINDILIYLLKGNRNGIMFFERTLLPHYLNNKLKEITSINTNKIEKKLNELVNDTYNKFEKLRKLENDTYNNKLEEIDNMYKNKFEKLRELVNYVVLILLISILSKFYYS